MSKDKNRWQRDQLLRDDRFRFGRSEEEQYGADRRHSPDAGYDDAGATYGGGYGGYYRGPYQDSPRATDRRSLRGFGGDEDEYGCGYYTYEDDDRGTYGDLHIGPYGCDRWDNRPIEHRGSSRSDTAAATYERSARDEWESAPQRGRRYAARDADGHEQRGFFRRLEDKVASFIGKGPKGYHRSDARIGEDVCERLTDHPGIDASDVEVVVRDAEVSLTGTVSDRRTKRMVEDVVERAAGVKDVHNDLRIRSDVAAETAANGTPSSPSTPTRH